MFSLQFQLFNNSKFMFNGKEHFHTVDFFILCMDTAFHSTYSVSLTSANALLNWSVSTPVRRIAMRHFQQFNNNSVYVYVALLFQWDSFKFGKCQLLRLRAQCTQNFPPESAKLNQFDAVLRLYSCMCLAQCSGECRAGQCGTAADSISLNCVQVQV